MIRLSNPTSDSARVKPPWPLKHAIILGCLGVVTTLLVILVVTTSVPRETLSSRELVPVETILECVAFTFFACLYLVIIRKDNWSEFWESIHWHSKSRTIMAWSGIGFLMSALIQYFNGVSLGINNASSPALTGKLILYIFLATVLMQPLIEEVYFRGVLFEALSSKVGWTWSISIVTIVFALSHVQHHWVVLPTAILLAVARISTRSTASCFALHASYNLGILAWVYWPVMRT
jgi:membrane protease YdiL (CAAX protease family)